MKGFQGFSIKTFLYSMGIISVILTFIPLLPIDHWWIRMFDFPHIQLTVLTFFSALIFLYKFRIDDKKEVLFLLLLLGCFIFQLVKISPYTSLKSEEVFASSVTDDDKMVTVFTANVLQKNDKYNLLKTQIDSIQPDIILLTETDQRWQEAVLNEIGNNYKYRKEVPLPNTYGMLLYSKLKLVDPIVNYLVDDSIPSIDSKVILRTGDTIQLYSIHPTPPMPQENPKSTDRDTEMMITAEMARKSKLPVIVLGDFNDVAWSNTTKLFKATGEVLDPRVGRGFYCSFDANNIILRWPLDHLFVSEEFRLKEINVCDDINSDHFPFYSRLTFEPDKADEQKPIPPTKQQLEDADYQIEEFRKKTVETKIVQ